MKLRKEDKIITTYNIKTQKELIEQGYEEVKEFEMPEKFTVKKKGL